MITNEMAQKMEVLFHNEEFAVDFFDNIDDTQKIIDLLAQNDITMTTEEADEFIAVVKNNVVNNETGELSESDMENVSGGVIPWIVGGIISGVFFGYQTYKNVKKIPKSKSSCGL